MGHSRAMIKCKPLHPGLCEHALGEQSSGLWPGQKALITSIQGLCHEAGSLLDHSLILLKLKRGFEILFM